MQYTEDREQTCVIEAEESVLQVVAGPGSGKTSCLLRRICRLLQVKGVQPQQILVLTFAKTAVQELKERVGKMQAAAAGIGIYTFHGWAYQLLRRVYGADAICLITEREKCLLMERALQQNQALKGRTDNVREYALELLAEIGRMKNEGVSAETFVPANCEKETFLQLYQSYKASMMELGKVDFDDLLLLCLRLMQEQNVVYTRAIQGYTHIFADEFQDINRVQYRMLGCLQRHVGALFLVGDDDQAIYSFRGATPTYMLTFHKEYPQGKQLFLSGNYRCAQSICQAAAQVIRHNELRIAKKIYCTSKNNIGECNLYGLPDLSRENTCIVELIRSSLQKGVPEEELCILARTNYCLSLLLAQLTTANIPYVLTGSVYGRNWVPVLYEHTVTQEVFAYLRLAYGLQEREDLQRICNRPNRQIPRELVAACPVTIEEMLALCTESEFRRLGILHQRSTAVRKCLVALQVDLDFMKRLPPDAALHLLRNVIGYHAPQGQPGQEILAQLAEAAKQYASVPEWLEAAKLETAQEKEERRTASDKKGIRVMTFHAAKGLEFDVVLLVYANEGITPYRQARSQEQMEEERRMFYVAMTRARRCLYITYHEQNDGKHTVCSRFAAETMLQRSIYPQEAKDEREQDKTNAP